MRSVLPSSHTEEPKRDQTAQQVAMYPERGSHVAGNAVRSSSVRIPCNACLPALQPLAEAGLRWIRLISLCTVCCSRVPPPYGAGVAMAAALPGSSVGARQWYPATRSVQGSPPMFPLEPAVCSGRAEEVVHCAALQVAKHLSIQARSAVQRSGPGCQWTSNIERGCCCWPTAMSLRHNASRPPRGRPDREQNNASPGVLGHDPSDEHQHNRHLHARCHGAMAPAPSGPPNPVSPRDQPCSMPYLRLCARCSSTGISYRGIAGVPSFGPAVLDATPTLISGRLSRKNVLR